MDFKHLPKLYKWQRYLPTWIIIQSSSVVLRYLSSAYRLRVASRFLSEAGNLKLSHYIVVCLHFTVSWRMSGRLSWNRNPEGMFYLVLANSVVTFLWVLHIQFIQQIVKQFRQEQFLAQMTVLATLKANSISSFFGAYYSFEVIGAARSTYVSL